MRPLPRDGLERMPEDLAKRDTIFVTAAPAGDAPVHAAMALRAG
ncbi:hypothetical protein [uncultured Methylobacterium sp.]